MPCKTIFGKDGRISMILCSRDTAQRCHVCGKPSTSLCDAIRKDGKPCDLPMCDDHRHKVAFDTDVCFYHNKPKYIKEAIEKRKLELN